MSTPAPAPIPQTPSFGGYASQPSGLPGVSFGPRVAARAIDMVLHYAISAFAGIMLALLLVMAAVVTGNDPDAVLRNFDENETSIDKLFAIMGASVFYMICTALHGSSPGKLILGMVVLQEDGKPCLGISAIKREIAYFWDALFFGMVAYGSMKDTHEQQRYGDKWADTIVVKRKDAPPASLRSGGHFALGVTLGVMADAIIVLIPWFARYF